jgi:hypothetical protein
MPVRGRETRTEIKMNEEIDPKEKKKMREVVRISGENSPFLSGK